MVMLEKVAHGPLATRLRAEEQAEPKRMKKAPRKGVQKVQGEREGAVGRNDVVQECREEGVEG